MQGVSGDSSLYHLYFPDVGLGMWVPHCRSIFQQGSHVGLICCCLDPRAVDLDVSSEESQGLIRLGGDVLDVGVPPEILGHGDPQVFGSLNMFQGVSMQCPAVSGGIWTPHSHVLIKISADKRPLNQLIVIFLINYQNTLPLTPSYCSWKSNWFEFLYMKEICTLLVKLHIIFSRMQRVNQHAKPSIIQVGCPTCYYRVCALDHTDGGAADQGPALLTLKSFYLKAFSRKHGCDWLMLKHQPITATLSAKSF